MDYASVDLQDAFLGKSGAAAAGNSATSGGTDAPAEKVNLVRLEDGCGIPVEKFEVASTDDMGGIPVEDGASDISEDEIEEMEEDKDATDSAARDSPTPSDATSGGGGGPKIIRTSAVNTDNNLDISKAAFDTNAEVAATAS